MANFVYPKARNALGEGKLQWSGSTVGVYLVETSAYTATSAHATINDLPAAARIAFTSASGPAALGSGEFDLSDSLFVSASASGDQGQGGALVVTAKPSAGAASASTYLIAYIDTGTNLPITTNGGNITVTWGAYVFGI